MRSIPLSLSLALLCLLTSMASGQSKYDDFPEITRRKPAQLDISWAAITDAEKYVVWRKLGVKGASWLPLKEVKGDTTSFSDPTLMPGIGASYKVEAKVAGGSKVETQAVGPVQPLADHYLELAGVGGSTARIHVHQWREPIETWVRSLVIEAKVGEVLAGEDLLSDFDTGTKVLKIGREPAAKGDKSKKERGWVKVMTKDHRIVRVLEGATLPHEVWQPEEKKKKGEAEGPKAKKAKVKLGKDGKPLKPLKFPEPRVVGKIPGKKRAEWEIENKSAYKMHFVIRGPKSYNFKVPADSTVLLRMSRPADYKIQVNAIADGVHPLEGEFGFRPGTRYATKFFTRELSPEEELERRGGKPKWDPPGKKKSSDGKTGESEKDSKDSKTE